MGAMAYCSRHDAYKDVATAALCSPETADRLRLPHFPSIKPTSSLLLSLTSPTAQSAHPD